MLVKNHRSTAACMFTPGETRYDVVAIFPALLLAQLPEAHPIPMVWLSDSKNPTRA